LIPCAKRLCWTPIRNYIGIDFWRHHEPGG
jgi:hypothetical protein